MAASLVVVGAGGHGVELVAYARQACAATQLDLLGVFDDDRERRPVLGLPILGTVDDLLNRAAAQASELLYVTAVGDNATRRGLVERIEAARLPNLNPWTCRHPQASIGVEDVQIGAGSCLAPGSIVTARAHIGRHCIANVKASISHDCAIGDYCNLNPGSTLCGNVRLGEGCYVGAGATIIEKITVGAWTVIGAGAVVVRDLPPGVLALGVPARVVKRLAPE